MSLNRLPVILIPLALVVILMSMQVGAGAESGIGPTLDPIRGGLMWDKWWVVNGAAEPVGDHPLYPKIGQKSGSTTYRCKECHGWDYKGVDGAYGSGSHFTGIPGVFGSTLTPSEMFDLIKRDDIDNGHGYENYGMTDADIDDVVEFLQTLVIDTDDYIDGVLFIGDEVQGEVNYTTGGSTSCATCHGPNGNWINFGDVADPVWVGTVAVDNPWEMLHKVRFGQPGTAMPSWIDDGGSDQGAADIGKYAQVTLPVGTCVGDVNLDGIVDVDDLLLVIGQWGVCSP